MSEFVKRKSHDIAHDPDGEVTMRIYVKATPVKRVQVTSFAAVQDTH